jgi:hypothetical protein
VYRTDKPADGILPIYIFSVAILVTVLAFTLLINRTQPLDDREQAAKPISSGGAPYLPPKAPVKYDESAVKSIDPPQQGGIFIER